MCTHTCHVRACPYTICARVPHEKLLGIQRVSNPSTGNEHASTPVHVLVVQIGNGLQFWVYGTNQRGRNPASKKLLGRCACLPTYMCVSLPLMCVSLMYCSSVCKCVWRFTAVDGSELTPNTPPPPPPAAPPSTPLVCFAGE